MQFELPNMLKQRPKQFWGMLKSKATREMAISTAEFIKFNAKIFYDPKIAPDEFTPLLNPTPMYITGRELRSVLALHFKADKSSGLSQMPVHLLKHMGCAGTECLATLYNKSAID
jgi:hypothetical protein